MRGVSKEIYRFDHHHLRTQPSHSPLLSNEQQQRKPPGDNGQLDDYISHPRHSYCEFVHAFLLGVHKFDESKQEELLPSNIDVWTDCFGSFCRCSHSQRCNKMKMANVKGCSGGEERALRLHPWLNKPGL